MKRGIKFFIALLVCLGVFQCVRPALADIPTLSLKDSVKVAEDALAKADIDLSNYYLFSIVFTNSSKGSYWYYTYRPNIPSVSNEVFVRVYMNGEAEVSGARPTRSYPGGR